MNSEIFHISSKGDLIELNQSEYSSEDLLQSLLAKYPSLIPGNQIDELNPRKWMFISREMSIPDSEESGGRWSLDHLFVDQDGIPTLIETKRSTDTRIRREIVGQMLDYAANATSYWTVDKIQAQFEARCNTDNIDPELELNRLFGNSINSELYWNTVEGNLNSGNIRMLFVADKIPFELKQIVEFLNEQMNPAEIYAVEIQQYVSGELKTLVPKVMGQTAKLQKRKSSQLPAKQWDEIKFMEEVEKLHDVETRILAKKVLDWVQEQGWSVWWGRGAKQGSFVPYIEHLEFEYFTFSVWTYGAIDIQFQWMKNRPIYGSEQEKIELLNKLNEIPGINISKMRINGRPSFPIKTLSDTNSLNAFFSVWDEYCTNIKQLPKKIKKDN